MTQATMNFDINARRSDPSTSQQSADDVRSSLARIKRAVVDVVNASDEPLTANEIAAIAVSRAYVTNNLESVRKRVAEVWRA